MHCFPNSLKEKDRCLKWIVNIRRADLNLSNVKSKRVCSVHFEEKAYCCPQDISSSRLLPGAVPTLISCPNPPKTIAPKCAAPKERPVLLSRKRSRDDDIEMLAALKHNNTEPPPSKKVKVDKSLETLLSETRAALKKCRAQNKKLYRQNTNLRKMNTKLRVQQQLDRKKQIKINVACQTARTESCPKSQKKQLTKKTCNDEHSDTEKDFIITIERNEDDTYEKSVVISYLSSETETASETQTILEKRVKIEPDNIPNNTLKTSSKSEESHGHSSHPADAVKLEPDSNSTEWPALTGLPVTGAATELEVNTEPCSDTEEKPLVFFGTSNMEKSTYLADSNMMSEPVKTFVKS